MDAKVDAKNDANVEAKHDEKSGTKLDTIVVRDYAPNNRRSGVTNILKHLQTIDF